MADRWLAERQEVLAISQEMARKGLVVGSSGNVSLRINGPEELLAITPSGRHYHDLTNADIQVIDFEAEPVQGDLIPSVETMMHVAAYRARPDIRAFVHTHSVYASALAVAHEPLPPVLDEMVTSIGGEIPVTEYAFASSEELADRVGVALAERNAALMANHGVVGVGKDLRAALTVCELVERAANIYAVARALGRANPLPGDVVSVEQDLFRMMHLDSEDTHR